MRLGRVPAQLERKDILALVGWTVSVTPAPPHLDDAGVIHD
jgi:hypothetical protein